MLKPDGYPLPWCHELGVAYWRANYVWCWRSSAWAEWQSTKSMAQIIPVLRWVLGLQGERGQ